MSRAHNKQSRGSGGDKADIQSTASVTGQQIEHQKLWGALTLRIDVLAADWLLAM
jgi:hypothetical protein